MTRLTRLFADHPASVDETYGEHLLFALTFAFWLGAASLAALIHALLPFLFEKTAGRIVARLYHRTRNRHASAAAPAE